MRKHPDEFIGFLAPEDEEGDGIMSPGKHPMFKSDVR
jgi:hypothetical protein